MQACDGCSGPHRHVTSTVLSSDLQVSSPAGAANKANGNVLTELIFTAWEESVKSVGVSEHLYKSSVTDVSVNRGIYKIHFINTDLFAVINLCLVRLNILD